MPENLRNITIKDFGGIEPVERALYGHARFSTKPPLRKPVS